MQSEDRLYEVDRPFFGNTLYPPLIAKEPKSCLTILPGWKCIKVTGCIVGTTLGGALTYILADSLRVMIETPPSSLEFSYNAAQVGIATLLAAGASCVGIAACCFFRWGKKKVAERVPYLQHYQGSFFTPVIYHFRHESLRDKKLCMELIEACFDEINQRGLLDPWLRCRKLETRESAVQYMFKSLNRGTCYGHSMALLGSTSTLSVEKLLDLSDNLFGRGKSHNLSVIPI